MKKNILFYGDKMDLFAVLNNFYNEEIENLYLDFSLLRYKKFLLEQGIFGNVFFGDMRTFKMILKDSVMEVCIKNVGFNKSSYVEEVYGFKKKDYLFKVNTNIEKRYDYSLSNLNLYNFLNLKKEKDLKVYIGNEDIEFTDHLNNMVSATYIIADFSPEIIVLSNLKIPFYYVNTVADRDVLNYIPNTFYLIK